MMAEPLARSAIPGQVYTGRRIVARPSLADIANPAASVANYSFAERNACLPSPSMPGVKAGG